jgi:cytochrome P450
MIVLLDEAPLFSKSLDCSGVVAVFGTPNNRAVLSDINAFGMPMSAGQYLSLPPLIANLNHSVHSMRGKQHDLHRNLLSHALNEISLNEYHTTILDEINAFVNGWRPGNRIPLLSEMRKLAIKVASRILLGSEFESNEQLGLLIDAYFHLRRESSSPFRAVRASITKELIQLGSALDEALRKYTRWCRANAGSATGLLAKLIKSDSQELLSENDLIAHGNVLFISSTEPIAVASTWILLILSQLPMIRWRLRRTLEQRIHSRTPDFRQLMQVQLLNSIINESLRLLPPNALMMRLTTQPIRLGNRLLPDRCELVLCPFLEHRDPVTFPCPNMFLPKRWETIKPSAFEYFPFGAGGHSCIGRHLALYLLKATVTIFIQRYDLLLADDQEIDWRIHVQFMPSTDPVMSIRGLDGSPSEAGGALRGEVSHLLNLDVDDKAVASRYGCHGNE